MAGTKRRDRWRALALLAVGLVVVAAPPGDAQLRFGEREYAYELSDVLPEAAHFVRVDNYWRGFSTAAADELVGYVFLSDDLVDVPGYSGETMNTLVGMDTAGNFTGVKIIHHAEPIVLIGLSEDTIHTFIDQYADKRVTDRILISNEPKDGYVIVDGISGATVTAVAENATILEASRAVARAEGVVAAADVRTARPSTEFRAMTWSELESVGAIGTLRAAPGDKTVDVRFAVLDPPSIGKNLLGDRFYEAVEARRTERSGSAIFIGGSGELSFKGAGFARGGIFDRFMLEQDGELFVFKDVDYLHFPTLAARGAPSLREGGVFFVGELFDPTRPFSFRLTVPYRINDERKYQTFLADYHLPGAFVDADVPFWRTRWQQATFAVLFTGMFLALLFAAFFFKERMTPHRKLLHRSTALAAVVVLGLWYKAQPSTTQILALFGSLKRFDFPAEIYLSEPLIFLLWIAIAVSLVIWGRGFFCGWVCPYGALLELLITVWQRIVPHAWRKRIDGWKPPPYLRYGKFVTFLVILIVSFVSLPLAEALDEVEPFKTFVLGWTRPPAFLAYFVILTIISVVSYRFFCRFMCPLGGALALPSTKKPLLPLFRYQSCENCRICAKGCEPGAISFQTGRIDYQECLQCWDCQATGRDENVCPELIVSKKQDRAPVYLVSLSLLAIGLGAGSDIHAADTRVPPGELSSALAAASAGDVLVLEPGRHSGPIIVRKRITLRAEEGAVIDGGGVGHAVTLTAPGSVIEGATVENCRVDEAFADAGIRVEKSAIGARASDNEVRGCRFGVWVHGARNVELTDNRIQGIPTLSESRRGDCIHLHDADAATVSGNHLTDCRDGIYMELTSSAAITTNRVEASRYAVHTMWCDRSRYVDNQATGNLVGLALMFSERIEALRNVLYDNRSHGLLLVQVTRARVTDNTIIGNTKGLFVYNSLYNAIEGNLVARNHLGVHYWGGSQENVMTDNAFIGNELQAKFVAAKDQEWRGNFWSDYSGWDVDDDGAGETPYRSNTLVDVLLWNYPEAKYLLASPALQLIALAEREFPVITVPKAVDGAPLMVPPMRDWESLLARYPASPDRYYLEIDKLPHLPGGHH